MKNEYESDEEQEEDDYVNVEPVYTVEVKEKRRPAKVEETETEVYVDDYEELDSADDHNYEEATPRVGSFTRARPPPGGQREDPSDDDDDEGDYENVLRPLGETEAYGEQEDIYQNL